MLQKFFLSLFFRQFNFRSFENISRSLSCRESSTNCDIRWFLLRIDVGKGSQKISVFFVLSSLGGWGSSVWPIPYTSANLQAGYECISCKNTSAIRVKIQTLTVRYSIFQKWQELILNNAITQFLDWPCNGLSELLKLELLSSDSFYCQGALKTSFRREIMKRCG